MSDTDNLSAPGDAEPVGWVQVHPNGHKAFYDGNPLLVHDNGMPTFPVYRRPVEPVVTDEMVERALTNWFGGEWRSSDRVVTQERIEGMRFALEAALNVSQPGVK